MLLKNPFAKTQPAPPAVSAQAVSDLVKGKQLLRGRTRVKVETLQAEVGTARVALAQAEQALGERMGDELDVTDATDTMKQAGDRVRALEVALAVAIQKDESALADLKDAERQEARAVDDETVAAFQAAVLELEGLLCGALNRAADKVGVTYTAVKDRSGSDTGVTSSLTDFRLWLPVYLHRSCASMIEGGKTYVAVIDKDKKTLSAFAGAVAYAMTRRKGR